MDFIYLIFNNRCNSLSRESLSQLEAYSRVFCVTLIFPNISIRALDKDTNRMFIKFANAMKLREMV